IIAAIAFFNQKKPADAAGNAAFDDKIKTTVMDLVKQNPQLIMDAMGEGIAKKREETIKQLSNEVFKQKEDIAKQSMTFGAADSKTAVVCFFDPLCKHCIEFQRSMIGIIKSKSDVCFKLMPVAVLGEDSVTLAKLYISIYDKNKEKALAFIEKITEVGGAMDKDAIEKALKSIGLTSKDLEDSLAAADKKLVANGVLAEKLKIPVVPAIFKVVGSDSTMIQATGKDDLLKIIGVTKTDSITPAPKEDEVAKQENDSEATKTETENK
ncbi:MAG: hypothetical protein EOM53_06195, partial [Alphaproteobacteria bacterium]|nr:hypothetical protein [Alphaproteobacteria bacterium]